MDEHFWVESHASSEPTERRICYPKCSSNWKILKRFAPNRGHYDITEARVVNICKITSALLWFCPGGQQKSRDIVEVENEDSNYLESAENCETTIMSSRLPEFADSRTFTKRAFRRKCRPGLLKTSGNGFEKCESFLLAVSIRFDAINKGITTNS